MKSQVVPTRNRAQTNQKLVTLRLRNTVAHHHPIGTRTKHRKRGED
ncbi:MAG TPA: hypothetical protein VFR51_08725 [Pyrinomonadaceae bacterium]|nr:hypothetical protein [Pyrinomonadaceae bacterium]